MMDGKIFFDQPINHMIKTYENIRKFAIGQGDDYTTGCLLDYSYFKDHYKMTAIDLSKQQALDADPRAYQKLILQQIQTEQEIQKCSLLLKKQKKNCFGLFKRNRKSFVNTILLNAKFIKYFFFLINIKMTQYNSLNVKLSNSQLNKFKSAIKNETEVVLRLSSNMIGDNETNFPHKLLLTNRQVANLRKAFANHLSTDIKLSKTQLSKMIPSR